MAEIAVALGATYLLLAVVHGMSLDVCRRRFWCVVHSIALSAMGLLYMVYGAASVLH